MSMTVYEIAELNRKNIDQAICDYGAHTTALKILDDVSDDFIEKLAYDAAEAKYPLYCLLSKSPAWNDDLQALVINGTRTHNPNETVLKLLGQQIFDKVESSYYLRMALAYFTNLKASPEDREEYIKAIVRLAPDAYKPNKKKSRIFKGLCDALGVTDNTAGSEFQKLFAQFADELSTKKLDFKLFVSINPAHFITMSNPKADTRGEMLTSCHSFNTSNYGYNNGCSGYARDDVTMIAFTVYNPNNAEELNNSKTSRQLFMYKVGNGVLLQSRMYNSRGGTSGVQKDSRLYRDLIQREISEAEGVPNLWKTKPYNEQSECTISPSSVFGGYPDWLHRNFAARISIRADKAYSFTGFKVGRAGLCVICGEPISEGLYCDECSRKRRCHHCHELHNRADMVETYDEYGNVVMVCANCLREHYFCCEHCGEYHHISTAVSTAYGYDVCQNCAESNFIKCSVCGEWHFSSGMRYMEEFNEYVCDDCFNEMDESDEHICDDCFKEMDK